MSGPPFRAEHIGSLIRPKALLDAREKFEANEVSYDKLKPVEDESINWIVDFQKRAGIKAITDGEYRRQMFFCGFFDNLDGMEFVKSPPIEYFRVYVPDVKAFLVQEFHGGDTWLCRGPLKRKNASVYVDQFNYTASRVAPEERKNIKITLCSPLWYHLRHGSHAYEKSVYSNDAEYFAAVAQCYQAEIKDLYDAGCRNVQFDDPLLAYFCAEPMLVGLKEDGINPDELFKQYLGVYNDCLKGRPKDMVVGLHLCRGNFKGGVHFSEGGYDNIARALFNDVDVDCFYLEYDTERAGSFEPLAEVPVNKRVVLGIVSSKIRELEDPEYIKKRVHEAAKYMKGPDPLSRLSLSPQCGFASHSDGNNVDEQVVENKLKLVVNTAKELWPDA